MNPAGPWQFEFEIDEHRLGHLLWGQDVYRTATLPLEFLLATAPDETFSGKVQSIATRASPSAEGANIVELFASLDLQHRPPHPRIGAEARAKIDCDPRSREHVLFGAVVEFVQKYFWFYSPWRP